MCIAYFVMLGGHTGLNSTHAKSCRLNLYGADRQHFPVAYYSNRTPSYVRLPILTAISLVVTCGHYSGVSDF
jgi:hypothetical protein